MKKTSPSPPRFDLDSLLDLTAQNNQHAQLVSDLTSAKVLGQRRSHFYGADSSSEDD